MSDENILADAAGRLFADLCTDDVLRRAEMGEWLPAQWAAVEEIGLLFALVAEEAGGFGVPPRDALDLVRLAAFHGLPLPLAETMLANHLLGNAGLDVGAGVASVAPVREEERLHLMREGEKWRLAGQCRRVPWGRNAATIAVWGLYEGQPHIATVSAGGWRVEAGTNIAGSPRDTVVFDAVLPASAVAAVEHDIEEQIAALAALRVLAMAGALERLLELTAAYSGERVQFGRPIGKFQAVQQNMAVLAEQSCAAAAAANIAARGFIAKDILPIAIAKARAGEAATVATAIAHQVHGAIGFTAEHRLHFFTKQLWSWRDELGSEAIWNRRIGRQVAKAGADALWSLVTNI
jgi:acyl-CoA dehydrogenase